MVQTGLPSPAGRVLYKVERNSAGMQGLHSSAGRVGNCCFMRRVLITPDTVQGTVEMVLLLGEQGVLFRVVASELDMDVMEFRHSNGAQVATASLATCPM